VKIEYETSLADVEAWHREYLKQPEVVRAFRIQAFWTAFTSGLVLGSLCYGTTKELIPSLIVGAFFLVLVWLLIGRAIRHDSLKSAKKAVEADQTSSAIGPHSLELTSEGITEVCQHHTLAVRWAAVATTVQTGDHFFIVLRSLSVFIIPLRSFSSPEDRASFIQRVLSFCPADAPQPKTRVAQR
jgi:hypothetical protein